MVTFNMLSLAGVAILASVVAAVPIADDSDSRFTYYKMPTPLAGPCDLTTGPDGALWVADILVDKIARIDPVTGEVEEYTVPYTTQPLFGLPEIAGRGALECAIQPGQDGNLYATTGIRNQFLRINPTTKAITIFTPAPLPLGLLGDLQPLNDLYAGPTGMYFTMTTANLLVYFDYASEEFTYYPVPTPLATPVGVFYASDGAIWFCEFTGGKMGKLNITTGHITEYPLPAVIASPTVVRAETEGRYIWFTSFLTNAIGRIDIYTGEAVGYENPSLLSFPTEDTVDSAGNIWFSTATQNTLNYYTPSTGKFTTIEQPGTLLVAPISVPPAVNIPVHYGPGNDIWFADLTNNVVGRYSL